MTSSVPQDTAALLDGARMPLLGFGTWKLTGDEARDAVATALDTGYRHVDTATIYGNEQEVGAGLAASNVPRDEVFLTTKCPPRNAGREVETLRKSLSALGTDHVDLWLVHWPAGEGADLGMWSAFVSARDEGLTRSVGVSNYSLAQVDELTERTGVTPAVNQVKWSPLLFDRAVLDGHRDRGVVLEGYSTLLGGTLKNRVVSAVANRHGCTPAQALVRWHLQHGVVVIPKSSRAERIRSNGEVGELVLTEQDMSELDALGT